MTVTIYKPSKSATQAGRFKTKQWLLEYPPSKKETNPVTGWIGSDTTIQHLKLSFETKEQAIDFAKQKKLDFQVIEPNAEKAPTRKYEDNFK